jgi:hypothetical protein
MNRRVLAVVASLVTCCVAADAAAPTDPLIVHEWGTFTSVQGGNGVQVQWMPLVKTDLPDFVYSRNVDNGGITGVTLVDRGDKGSLPAVVRLETPVIYFYSQSERVVDVEVLFPNGRITEWYPQATSVGPYLTSVQAWLPKANRSIIHWGGVRILPQNSSDLSVRSLLRDSKDKEAGHYYAARETDANFLRVNSPHARDRAEYERDLFYRGVGTFKAPLRVEVVPDETTLTLSTQSAEPLTSLFVLTIRRGMMRYQMIERVTLGDAPAIGLDAQSFQALDVARDQLMHDMVVRLVDQGLYAKEAQAMVETWKDQWFAEEGTRVLYLLPRTWTDRTLPLQITPQPDSIVRVMVGRAEVIMPSVERKLTKQILAYGSDDAARQRQAIQEVRQLNLGRFAEAAMRVALGEDVQQLHYPAALELALAVRALQSAEPLSRTTR